MTVKTLNSVCRAQVRYSNLLCHVTFLTTLLFAGTTAVFRVETTNEGDSELSDDPEFSFSLQTAQNEVSMCFSSVKSAKKKFESIEERLEQIVQEMELQHVTASDFLELFLAHCEPPSRSRDE